jgi:Fic family protein
VTADVPPPRGHAPIEVAPVQWQRHDWRPRAPEIFSKTEVARQTGAYESAVTGSLASWSPRVGAEDAADFEDATLAIHEFDRYALGRLGSSDPAFAPMSAILLRTESASSSQIEQLTTSAKQLALAEIDEGDKANALTVVGNVRSMEAALRLADKLDEASVLTMHRELMSKQVGMEHEAGRFRRELVWIGGRDNAGPVGADFIAPQHDLVPSAVRDVLAFAQRTDVPILAQIAVAHAQFETIHPFVDGNGRTGRALAQAMLRAKGLSAHTTIPISAGLLTDLSGYFRALTAFRDGDAGPIIRRFADASRFAAGTGRVLVDGLVGQVESSREKLAGVRADSTVWRVLPRLVGQPIVNTRYLVSALGINRLAALRAVDTLVERGVVSERTGRARNRIWQHDGILGVLDEYAGTIRRSMRH